VDCIERLTLLRMSIACVVPNCSWSRFGSRSRPRFGSGVCARRSSLDCEFSFESFTIAEWFWLKQRGAMKSPGNRFQRLIHQMAKIQAVSGTMRHEKRHFPSGQPIDIQAVVDRRQESLFLSDCNNSLGISHTDCDSHYTTFEVCFRIQLSCVFRVSRPRRCRYIQTKSCTR